MLANWGVIMAAGTHLTTARKTWFPMKQLPHWQLQQLLPNLRGYQRQKAVDVADTGELGKINEN